MTILTPEPVAVSLRRPALVFAVVLPPALAGFVAGTPWAWGSVVVLSFAASGLWQAVNRRAQARRRSVPLSCELDGGFAVRVPSELHGPLTLVLRCVQESNGSGAVTRTVLWSDETTAPEPGRIPFRLPSELPAGIWELDVRGARFAARYAVPPLHVVATEAEPAAAVVHGQ